MPIEQTKKHCKGGKLIEGKATANVKQSTFAQLRASSFDGWFWEIASITLSAFGIIGTAVFLLLLNDKEVPSWSSRVSPNAILSMTSTATNAAMILGVSNAIGQFKWLRLGSTGHSLQDMQRYDVATRGPLGAFKLLFRNLRNGPFISRIASIGCVVMIAAVAIDPSFQQILKYIPTEIPVSGTGAGISRASIYNFGDTGIDSKNTIVSTRDPGLLASIYPAVLGSPTPMSVTCPTVKCEFPEFATLGANSHCSNITSQSYYNCSLNAVGETICNVTLPGYDEKIPGAKLSLEGSRIRESRFGWEETKVNMTVQYTKPKENFNGSLAQVSLVRFYGTPNSSLMSQGQWFQTAEAWQCNLSLAAYIFSDVSILNNSISIPKVSLSQLMAYGNRTEWVNDTSVRLFTTTDASWPSRFSNIFGINYIDMRNISTNLWIFWMGKVRFAATSFQTALSNALQYPTSVPGLFDEVASSLTHHMMSAAPNATIADGVAYYPKTKIHVRWAWLSVSVVLWILSAVYLSAAILMTHSRIQPAWKSSLYPLLTLKITDDDLVDDSGAVPTIDWKLSRMSHVCSTAKSISFDHRNGYTK